VHESGALSKHVEPFFGERFRDACRGDLWTTFRGANRPVWSYGNVLVVIVISKLRKKKQPTDFYVQKLAIADLGILTFAFSLGVIKEKAPFNWVFGEFACRYLYAAPEMFHGASVWFIAIIAMERYSK